MFLQTYWILLHKPRVFNPIQIGGEAKRLPLPVSPGFYIRQTLVVQRTRSNFNSKQYLIVNVFLLLVSYKHFVSKVSMIYSTNVRQNRVTSDESCFTTVTFVGREANISYLCLKPQKHSLSIGLSCPGFSFYEHVIDNLLVRFLLYSNP